ncbi:TPA: transcription-repair coupling factor [Streptococcus pneumoniae]
MVTLLDLFSENDQIKKWHQSLTDKKRQLILGLSTSTKALAIASSLEKEDRIVLLTSTYGEAEGLVSDLISILGEELVYPFLVDDAPMVEFLMSSQEKIISRVEALRFLTDSSKKGILVCNIAASRLILPSPNAFKDSIVKISVGEEYDQHAFIHQLKENGYRKVTQVQTQGEFSLRGDILDIFEMSQLEPCRIEFFGDEIDGIRSFEVETQLSKEKQKVKNQVEDIADDLIKLYSERSQLKGFAFSADDDDQDAFDDAFPYVETDDQLRSIEEIKRDMQASQPMDRLLVGDVGFGKTEVAMRAAFKAVNDHKQVVILVPTTVLAQQHYTNFKERFQNFAVNVDVLSRFRSKKEQTATLEKLKNGQVDILIGTHRVLSKDVVFADLGLMIIDEEQRFGVKHKETLKELKKQVDVLTLTATPIPRTLHMSMLGIRDLSVIETPPTNRYPVQTYVLEKNDSVIRDAVLREMERGGQVYYLYNKVDTIVQKVSELQELIPEASIGYVHGRMSEVQLENTLLDFIEGQYDILVTTTIIETGVDIPNANTLFIENADHMGLSTLYQLRGRVGRSNRIAYAYLMYRPEKSISEVSEKRLEAIKGFTELGSGFKIAMRDLSIRGAGNLLGKSQSGFIDSVGFELYSQLLEEAIAKRNGNANANTRTKGNAELVLQIDAYLPDTYISDQRHKIEIYKKIRQIDNRVNYEELQEELIDRFGEYPDVVAYLLEIGLVKSYLDKVFVQRVERKDNKITIQFEKVTQRLFLAQDYFKALSVTNLKAGIAENKGLMELVFDVQNKKDYEILEGLLIFGESLLEIKEFKEENSI